MISNQLGREIFRMTEINNESGKDRVYNNNDNVTTTTMAILLFNCCRSPVCLHDP